MFRSALVRPVAGRSAMLSRAVGRRTKSTKAQGGALEGDSGNLATHGHHTINSALAVMTPLYFVAPDYMTDGALGKAFGVALSGAIAAHSWIGMNYVATDYVPKLSKKLIGPARVFNAGLGLVTLLGLAKISVFSRGGLKGCVKGLWNPPPPKTDPTEA